MTDVLVCVDPEKVDELWPHVRPFIDAAFDTELGDDNTDSVKADLDARHALLWIVWNGNKLIAAATTKIVRVPAKKLCIITTCAGQDLSRWLHFLVDMEKYAKAEGCDAMRIMGRRGWKAMLPTYHEPWVCLEKELS